MHRVNFMYHLIITYYMSFTLSKFVSLHRLLAGVWLLSFSISVSAASYRRAANDNYHFVYLSGSAGYSMLQNDMPELTPAGKIGGLVGLGYEFRHNGFWMSVGAQTSFHRSSLTVTDMTFYPHQSPTYATATFYDTQGKEIFPRYNVSQTDHLKWMFLDVPIMAGYYVQGFYVGAGVKISYAVSSDIETSGEYDFSANYVLYPEVGIEVGHGYGHYEYPATSQSVSLKPSASLIGEVGYDLLSSMPTRSATCSVLKLGFYFEYGISRLINPAEYKQNYTLSTLGNGGYDLTKLHISPYLTTAVTNKNWIVPFYTGVKLTVMIGGSRGARTGYHKGCQCYAK
ncbi:MAG: hypothetical protein ACI4TV_05180 [Paludibacteraceae bacterium]